MFAGNVAEASTLQDMLQGLKAPIGAMVIMDREIATEANLLLGAETKRRFHVHRPGYLLPAQQ